MNMILMKKKNSSLQPLISIIIITLNESKTISKSISTVKEAARFPSGKSIPIEIIVSDGGSTDGTQKIAERFADIVIQAPRGRFQQSNLGGKIATSEILMFLHSDVLLQPGAIIRVIYHLKKSIIIGGAFSKSWKWTKNYNPTSFAKVAVPIFQWAGNLWFRILKIFPADNTIFIRKSSFEELNGFAPMWICEGFDLSRRMKKHAKKSISKKIWINRGRKGIACIHHCSVYASTRRFEEEGFIKTFFKWLFMFFFWRLGMSQDGLRKLFRNYKDTPNLD